jgi:signal transduction histidine kinase
MKRPILSVALRTEPDVVVARQRAKQIAALLGFDNQQQTRIATAVSEIARNTFNYGGPGKAEFLVEEAEPRPLLVIRVSDRGPGIANLAEILAGEYESATGMGLGIVGARRLMDRFEIQTGPGEGTTIYLGKFLPGQGPVRPATLARIASELARQELPSLGEEIQVQNLELLRALEQLEQRQEEQLRLNQELEDTNLGVLALYAELDERAQRLRQADELKSRFLSNMSHEFRTPLNSILALTRLLLSRADGELNEEQALQVNFIRKAAENLAEMVNDLLDLAKVEAGKVSIYPEEFQVIDLFSALRGMFRPLLTNNMVDLVFEETRDLPPLFTDEG